MYWHKNIFVKYNLTMSMKLHIGIDDTDSKRGMCTTYLGTVLRDRLAEFSEILDNRLVRLNPNIPWKTRGNGAVALTIETQSYEKAIKETLKAVTRLSSLDEEGTNPGVVFLTGEVDSEITSFYYQALREVATIEEAEALAKSHGCEVEKFNNGRGIIGALAAIGADLAEHTFELTTYRRPEKWGTPRKIDQDSVYKMDQTTYPETFNNIDREVSRVLITPRSPCPVLFGIRGKTTEILEKAKDMIKSNEPIDLYSIFKTNQGTDAHLVECGASQVRPFTSVMVKGTVERIPETLRGGHVVFPIAENGSRLDCAAYEPTGGFREIVKRLHHGDVVTVYGGVKNTKGLTVNLEKLDVHELKDCFEEKNPFCPECKKRMDSAGKGQGFRCRRCRTTSVSKEFIQVERELKTGLYCVPSRAMRHLAKPVEQKEV
jgi:tRNA(Ile2)-agmatinylcytidine synthase